MLIISKEPPKPYSNYLGPYSIDSEVLGGGLFFACLWFSCFLDVLTASYGYPRAFVRCLVLSRCLGVRGSFFVSNCAPWP